jgi:hypothetical protein
MIRKDQYNTLEHAFIGFQNNGKISRKNPIISLSKGFFAGKHACSPKNRSFCRVKKKALTQAGQSCIIQQEGTCKANYFT